jgi:hypothetical protein
MGFVMCKEILGLPFWQRCLRGSEGEIKGQCEMMIFD